MPQNPVRNRIEKLRNRLVEHAHFLKFGKGKQLHLKGERFNRLIAQQIVMDKATLEGCAFGHSDLSGASMRGAEISYSEFGHCNLQNCDFRQAKMRGVRISFSDVQRARMAKLIVLTDGEPMVVSTSEVRPKDPGGHGITDFSNSDFSSADLTDANLSSAVMRGANLTGACLDRADLSGADLTGACLTNIDFSTTNLEGAVLDGALFSINEQTREQLGQLKAYKRFEANTRTIEKLVEDHEIWAASKGQKSAKANFHDRSVMGLDFSGRNLAAVDFSRTTIVGTRFNEAVLASSNFRGATIRFTSFDNTDARAMYLVEATIENSSFRQADFRSLVVEGYAAPMQPNWKDARFIRCDFTGAQMPDACREQAVFEGCMFDPAP